MLYNGIGESRAEVESAAIRAGLPNVSRETRPDWRAVDRALRTIRHSRAALDAEEMHWLREAEALQIWHPLGMVSAIDYLERALGYAPRTAQDRLRVARALGSLPKLTAALAEDRLTFSAVRELTRVATPATEAAWIAAAAGKNLRQIEDLVADHRSGDRPDDPPDPEARTHVVRFELAAETFALLRQARTVLDDEHGTNLSDDAFVAALCHAVLDGGSTNEPTGRAKFQIAMTVCQRCRRGWQEGAGAQIAIRPEAVDRALCDAQHIGSIDGSEPERAYQDIPPSVARFVWRRDGGRCRVDGCRSARGLELHHIVHRADGGSHSASNIILCCSHCHQSHHTGLLTISGTAQELIVRRPGEGFTGDTDDRLTDMGANAGAGNGIREAEMPKSVVEIDAHVGVTATTTLDRATLVPATRAKAPIPQADVHEDEIEQMTVTPEADTRVGSAATTTPIADVARCAEGAIMAPYAHVGASSRLDAAILRAQAKAALTGLGWKPAIAHAAVAAAMAAAEGDTDVTVEGLIFESLRRCPVPKA